MSPAFSNALYYPSIDIRNSDWLKTALLFWDSISTIVPESYSQPYRQHDTQFLADIGYLRPLIINSHNRSVVKIEDEIIDLMLSPEFKKMLCSPRREQSSYIYRGKMSYRLLDSLLECTNKEYCSKEIAKDIELMNNSLNNMDAYYLPNEFVYTYMMVLANNLCEEYSLGLVTDDVPSFNFCDTIRFDNKTTSSYNRYLDQGLLINYIINGISISPDTNFEDIVLFKKHHQDELGRFRTQLSKFIQGCKTKNSFNAIQQEISDLYVNEFMPAFDDLKKALTSSRIKWFTETFLKVSTLSVSSTSVPTALLGLPVEQAILAGVGVSVIASTISYSAHKKECLRKNPYSYLLSIKKELG